MTDNQNSSISFKAICDDDKDFLRMLYGSTRETEMAMVPWSQAEKKAFITAQFNAQHAFYHEQFKRASFQLIIHNDKPIGRLYLDRRKKEIRIIDIALIPTYRQMGIGGKLLQDLISEAHSSDKSLTIHVEKNNPAKSLYDRLGFQEIEDQGVYLLMECAPS